METVLKNLEKVLANNYALYLKTQSYHWNVKGPHFASLHAFFEDLYSELAQANDDIAERIRALGYPVEASFSAFNALSLLTNANAALSSDQMVEELLHDHEKIREILIDANKVSDNASDLATSDFLTERIRAHEKNIWMLRSLRG